MGKVPQHFGRHFEFRAGPYDPDAVPDRWPCDDCGSVASGHDPDDHLAPVGQRDQGARRVVRLSPEARAEDRMLEALLERGRRFERERDAEGNIRVVGDRNVVQVSNGVQVSLEAKVAPAKPAVRPRLGVLHRLRSFLYGCGLYSYDRWIAYLDRRWEREASGRRMSATTQTVLQIIWIVFAAIWFTSVMGGGGWNR